MTLTEERKRHIQQRHPGLLTRHLRDLREALATPDAVVRSAWSASTRLFHRWLPTFEFYLVVAVVTPPPFASGPWIVTAYFSPKIQERRSPWDPSARPCSPPRIRAARPVRH